jgi:serine/threonine-protein kinase
MSAPELKTLGRYNIERVIGKGAMGVVYEGVDPRLGRRVAIKTILKSHLDDDTAKDFAMRFVREAQAVARLNHPHIVQVYDFGEEAEVAYLVMEFIRGKELKNFFDANERFDIKEAVRIMCELCDALDFAHHAGIVHRDIKPANVMLDHQARTKLTDFGVARVQDTDKTSVERTQAGTMVGTPAYMSPEQITGGTIDKRTDVFSAGIILYQFLTGEKPFTGSGAWTIAKKIIQEEPPLPSSLNNAVTPLFDAVVNKALAKDPEKRYQSAKDLAIALRRALEGKESDEDADRTVVGEIPPMVPPPRPEPRPDSTRSGTTTSTQNSSQEVELEFWRSIKDGNDPDDFELYVQQFPTGIYAALAKRKIAKLRGVAPEESSAKIKEQEKREADEAAKREAAALDRLNEEKARLEAEYQKREAESRARAEAAAKEAAERAEAAERDARAKAEAAEKARLEAIEKAKQEAAAELAKREAEFKRREAEAEAKRKAEEEKRQAEAKARLEAEAKARAEAEAKAKREAEARAKAEAEAKAKREAEEKARRDADAKAKAEAEARAKREAEEKARRDAEIAKREAELKRLEAEAQAVLAGDETVIARKTRASRVTAIVASLVVALIAGGVWWFTKPDPSVEARKVAELQKQLEQAKQKEAELQKAKEREAELQKQVELARRREEEAKKSGDLAKQKALAEETRQREAEARKQAEVTKQRETEAKKQADLAQRQKDDLARRQQEADARKQAELERQRRDAEAKKLAEKIATEKLAAERAALEREAAERIAAAERAAKEAAERAAAAEKAAAEQRAAAERAARQQVARAPSNVDALLQQAAAKESEGDNRGAVKLYVQAARAGSGKAAKRLGDIYTKGVDGVPRDYAESLKWYNAARVLGEEVDLQKSR